MRYYLAEKMMGIPFFNAPWFNRAAETLRKIEGVTEVFNPAEHDVSTGFDPMKCPNGSAEEAEAAGFVRRLALGYDWSWIAQYSNGLIVGPMWRWSTGAISEVGCHQALSLPVYEYEAFIQGRRTRIPPLITP